MNDLLILAQSLSTLRAVNILEVERGHLGNFNFLELYLIVSVCKQNKTYKRQELLTETANKKFCQILLTKSADINLGKQRLRK